MSSDFLLSLNNKGGIVGFIFFLGWDMMYSTLYIFFFFLINLTAYLARWSVTSYRFSFETLFFLHLLILQVMRKGGFECMNLVSIRQCVYYHVLLLVPYVNMYISLYYYIFLLRKKCNIKWVYDTFPFPPPNSLGKKIIRYLEMTFPPDPRNQNRRKDRIKQPAIRTRRSDAVWLWLRSHSVTREFANTVYLGFISFKWYSHKQVDLPFCVSTVYSLQTELLHLEVSFF